MSTFTQVTFSSGFEVTQETTGVEGAPAKTAEVPTVKLGGAKEGALYTVILSDPDAPSTTDRKFGEWIHYRVVNCPAATDGTLTLSEGKDTVAYVGPAPGDGSGKHRYTLVVYEQAKKIEDDGKKIAADSGFAPRRSFNSSKYAEERSLTPVAAVRFLAAFDDSVPAAHKKLTGQS